MTAALSGPVGSGQPRRRTVLRPAPPYQPPFDDEVSPGQMQLVAGHDQLTFDLPFDAAVPASRRLRGDADFGPQPTRRELLPDPTAWAGAFIRSTLEVLAGRRPCRQLRPATSPAVYAALTRACGPDGAARRPALDPLAVRSVHVCEPADGVAEVCAVVRRGHSDRFAAVAVRLEGLDGTWRCVTLQIG